MSLGMLLSTLPDVEASESHGVRLTSLVALRIVFLAISRLVGEAIVLFDGLILDYRVLGVIFGVVFKLNVVHGGLSQDEVT